MANARLYIPQVLKWEGGFVNDPSDHGGTTNENIILEDLNLLINSQ